MLGEGEFVNAHGGVPIPKPERKSNYRKTRARSMERGVAEALRVAGDMQAKRQILSGAIKEMPGDVDSTHVLIECKNYAPIQANGKRMIRIDLDWLLKVMREAKDHHKPGIVVYQPKGSHSKIVVADFDQFLDLLKKFGAS